MCYPKAIREPAEEEAEESKRVSTLQISAVTATSADKLKRETTQVIEGSGYK